MVMTDKLRGEIDRVMERLVEDYYSISWHDVYFEMQEIIDPKTAVNVLSHEVQKVAERLRLKYKDMRPPSHSQTVIRVYSKKEGRLPPGDVLSLEDYCRICEISESISRSIRNMIKN